MNSAGNYDEVPRRIGNTNHITLVKPFTRNGGTHQEIRAFFSRHFPGAHPIYKDSLGSVAISGAVQTLAWQSYGASSDWLFTARWPCSAIDGQNTCGPWSRGYGSGFNAASPQENDLGFVVLKASSPSPQSPNTFTFSDTFMPATGGPTFNGKVVYSSLSTSATFVGRQDQDALTIKSMTVQPVIFQAMRSTPQTAKKSIPAQVGEEVQFDVPALWKDAKVTISSIAGDWSFPVTTISTGSKYGLLRVDAVERNINTTKITFSVWPR